MSRRKMSVTQLTLLTSLSMMGAGIIMLPAKFAEIGAISMLSWIVTALASGAVAYVFAQCGMLSKKLGGLGGFAEYAFGEPGAFIVNYAYAISLVFGNIAISLAAVSYGLSWFHLPFSSVFACIGCVLLLWIASLLTFRSPYITGRITGIFVWALLLPLIFGQMNKHDAAVKGLILLTGVQSLLCLPILSPSTFTIYEQFTDLAVFITLFAFVICMSGSFALAKAECTSPKRRETIHTIATAAIVMLLGSLYCLNFDTMKIGTVLVCLSWVYYGMLKGRLSASQ